jgi:hypothetical protein
VRSRSAAHRSGEDPDTAARDSRTHPGYAYLKIELSGVPRKRVGQGLDQRRGFLGGYRPPPAGSSYVGATV